MNWVVHCGDTIAFLQGMADNSVDAIITDPPYCSGAISEAGRSRATGQGLRSVTIQRFGWFVGDNMGTAGLVFLLRSLAFEAARVLVDGGSCIAFCDWRQLVNVGPAMESGGLRWANTLVWDKGHFGAGTGFRPQHEMAVHLTSGVGEFHDASHGNVLHSPRVHHTERHHPNEKPIALLRQLVRVVSKPGGLIFDGFCGSGSVGCAALLERRRFVGVDRDLAHVETARTRIAMAAADPMSDCKTKGADQIGLFAGAGA